MAITLTADELAAAVNGGDQWDAAEKTRMLALATAVYVAEGLKHETPDALSNEYAIRVAAFLAQSRDSIGQLDLGVRSHAQDPARASGARALVAPYLKFGA